MAVSINQCITTQNLLSVLGGQHEKVTIEGNDYGLITIGSRRYLIDYKRSKSNLKWYKDQTTRLDFISTADPDASVNKLPVNGVCIPNLTSDQVKSCSWEDAYRSTMTLRQVISSIRNDNLDNKSNYAGYYVGSLSTLNLAWSLPNYELASYIADRLYAQYYNSEDRDWLYIDTGWGEILSNSTGQVSFWLPFSYSVTSAWSMTCSRNYIGSVNPTNRDFKSTYLIALPCTLL